MIRMEESTGLKRVKQRNETLAQTETSISFATYTTCHRYMETFYIT